MIKKMLTNWTLFGFPLWKKTLQQ